MLTQNMKNALKSNISYLATSSKDGKPNVVPVGFVEAVDDSHIMIVDVHMDKPWVNLAENGQVALSITDLTTQTAYQFKGHVKIVTSGKLFDRAREISHNWVQRRKQRLAKQLEETNDSQIKAKLEFAKTYHLEPNAVVPMEVEEIYPQSNHLCDNVEVNKNVIKQK
jgi:uncharacterized protein